MPIPPVSHFGLERFTEIQRMHAILPPDLPRDPDFAVDYPLWDNYHHQNVVLDKR
jgi:hypothetical protein